MHFWLLDLEEPDMLNAELKACEGLQGEEICNDCINLLNIV